MYNTYVPEIKPEMDSTNKYQLAIQSGNFQGYRQKTREVVLDNSPSGLIFTATMFTWFCPIVEDDKVYNDCYDSTTCTTNLEVKTPNLTIFRNALEAVGETFSETYLIINDANFGKYSLYVSNTEGMFFDSTISYRISEFARIYSSYDNDLFIHFANRLLDDYFLIKKPITTNTNC